MHLARVIRLDDSDAEVYAPAADPGEWAIPGSFAYADLNEGDVADGAVREAFRHGWLGLDSFGRASVVAVAPITEAERAGLIDRLAQHFVDRYGAPSIVAARPVAEEEISQMQAMCDDQDPNTMIVLEREFSPAGVKEKVRLIAPKSASLSAFAVHGELK